jgi:tetratricopeptide (TPR) repeat protein
MMRIARLIAISIVCITTPAFARDDNRIILGADPQLSDGATALSVGNYSEGIRLTELGLKGPPARDDRSAAMSNLCAGFAGTKEYDLALTHCSAALQIDERNWQAYNNRALTHVLLGHLEAAQQDIDRGLQINPESGQLRQVQKLVRAASTRK